MIEIFLWALLFVASLSILLKASNIFTDSAEEIGYFFKLPAFVIGVTIVAFGTSLPELISSIFAVIQGSSEIVSGNVVGSNVTNIFLVLGVAAIVAKKIKVNHEIINVDLPILMASAFLLGLTTLDGKFTFVEALLCLVGLTIYLFHTVTVKKIVGKEDDAMEKDLKKEFNEIKFKEFPVKSLVMLLVSMSFLFIGAKYTIDSAVKLSEILNIGKEVIAGTVIALGTSFPELAVSFAGARRGKADIVVGNVLGSNIFNSLGVMGVAGLFGVIVVPVSILTFGLPILVIATILYLFVTQDKEITRWEGSFLIILYIFYVGKLLGFV
ncbi:MAG: calcium/sodium antiporter [Patescibacteria group bacterium]|nr:calcium/sodium antiporter [Patescibacteria group bacterium]